MEKQFDFNEVGKRMPYRVPEGLFEHMQDNVMAEIQQPQPGVDIKPKARQRRAWLLRLLPLSAVAAAAVAALLILPRTMKKQTATQANSYAKVEQAFNNLSDADRDYLVTTYQDDLFLNQ